MKIFKLLLVYVISVPLFAQNGPGGIESTDGMSNLVLWLDANQITTVTEGNNVSVWADASGYGNDASQSLEIVRPNWFSNAVNGFPYVRFDDSGESLDGTLHAGLSGEASLFTVCFFDKLNQGVSDNDWVASFGSSNTVNSSMNIARRRDDGGTHNDEYFAYDGEQNNFGPVLTGQQWMLLSHIQKSAAPYHNMWLDGAEGVEDDFTTGSLSTNVDYSIGDWSDSPGATDKIEGKIPEVILFDRELNTAEIYILHSYLGAKYNIANSNDQYTGDDPANGDNDRDVIGIGTEGGSSNTEAYGAGLQLEQNSGFGDGDYVMAGHSVAINSINTTDVAVGYDARWDRAFWIDITEADLVGSIVTDIRFDYSEAGMGSNPSGAVSTNYKLVYSSTGTGPWTEIATASSVSGNQVVFNGIALTTDGYYTIATLDNTVSPLGLEPLSTSCKGPGGVEDTDGAGDLKLWLDPFAMRPGDGDELPIFNDFSGYGNSTDLVSVAMVPVLKTNIVNGMPVARYNGNNWNEGDLDAALGAPCTVIGVGSFDNDQGPGDNDYIISVGNAGTSPTQHTSISRRRNDTPADANKYYSWDGGAVYFGPVISTATWNIFYQENASTSPFHELYLDGTAQGPADYGSAFSATSTKYRVGMWQTGAGSGLDGDVGEVIIFDRILNSAERNIVTSYLSAKFDITIAGDQYTGDDAANDDNDLFVVGIGTESDGSNTCANSVGMIMEQSANFENGDYAMWGINEELNFVNYADASDPTDMLVARWNRDWWIDVTDASGVMETDITFDYSDAGNMGFPDGDPVCYFLLYRAGTSGDWTILQVGDAIQGDQVTFNDVPLTMDGYYTLGTCDGIGSPLPITLVDFDVKVIDEDHVSINWQTQSEQDNDYFKVMKSDDGLSWETIGEVDGAGNSSETIDYQHMDDEPHRGISYYRIGQVDLNGSINYTDVKSIQIEGVEIINAYPNPSDGEITVLVNISGTYDLEVTLTSIVGQTVLYEEIKESKGLRKLTFDLDGLSTGTYVLQIRASDGSSFDQIRIQLD